MEKMVSKNGIKVNMCCVLVVNTTHIVLVGHDYKRICLKKNTIIKDGPNKCNYYVMQDFFRKRGYKPL